MIDKIEFETINWAKFLSKASQNRVLYAFCKNLVDKRQDLLSPKSTENLSRIIKYGDKWLSKLQNTLLFLDRVFSDNHIKYIIAKTYRPISYVTYDVDVFVRPIDYSKAAEVLKSMGYAGKHPGKQAKKQVNLFIPNLLVIDLHKGFSWQGHCYFDESLIWTDVKQRMIADVLCPVPRPEIDVLLGIAHILFERRYITLLDLILVREFQKQVNWNFLIKQSEKYHWKFSLVNLLDILNYINYSLDGEESDFLQDFNIPQQFSSFRVEKPSMPFFLPLSYVFQVFYEKTGSIIRLPGWDLAYYFFTTARYYITCRRRLPYYVEWAPLEDLKWN